MFFYAKSPYFSLRYLISSGCTNYKLNFFAIDIALKNPNVNADVLVGKSLLEFNLCFGVGTL